MPVFSQRLPWSLPPNRLAHLLEQKRKSGSLLIDLTLSNPTHVLPGYPHQRIGEAYGCVRDFSYHPDPFGSRTAREVIANEYHKRGIVLAPDQIALTASTSEAYALLFKLFCDPGDEVLVPAPSYPLFEFLAQLESVKVSPYRLVYDGSWYIDFRALRRQITARSKTLVVVNPNNPTGSFLKHAERTALSELSIEHSLAIISDEVFMDYALLEGAFVKTLIGFSDVLSFSLNGLSKMAGMPQMKLGWIAINGPADLVRTVRSRLELVLDTYLSVNAPVQSALADLFTIGDEIRAKLLAQIRQNSAFLDTELRATAIHRLRTEGGWSAILQLPRVMPEETWIERLLTGHGVLVQPGYFFDMPSEAYAVVSLITEPGLFKEGIRRLKSLASDF